MGTEGTSYAAVHQRISRRLGAARNHPCRAHECDRQAEVWSWQRTGLSASGIVQGKSMSWGLELNDYAPMCRRHNATLDCGGTLTHCPAGHLRTEENTYESPTSGLICRECRREQRRARRARKIRRICTKCGHDFSEVYFTEHVRRMHPAITEGGEGND